jgi:hypothetical protein
MKKFAISLLALAAVSTASFAADSRSNNQHDSDAPFIKYSSQLSANADSANALIIVKKTGSPSSFDRVDRTKWEEDRGGNN